MTNHHSEAESSTAQNNEPLAANKDREGKRRVVRFSDFMKLPPNFGMVARGTSGVKTSDGSSGGDADLSGDGQHGETLT